MKKIILFLFIILFSSVNVVFSSNIKEIGKINIKYIFNISPLDHGFYKYTKEDKNFITNGSKEFEYDYLNLGSISKDGKNSLFLIEVNGKKKVIHNFEEVKLDKEYKYIDNLTVSEKGNHYSFFVGNKYDNGLAESFLISDGKKINLNGNYINKIFYLNDGKKLVYILFERLYNDNKHTKNKYRRIIFINNKEVYRESKFYNEIDLMLNPIKMYFNSIGDYYIVKNRMGESYDELKDNKILKNGVVINSSTYFFDIELKDNKLKYYIVEDFGKKLKYDTEKDLEKYFKNKKVFLYEDGKKVETNSFEKIKKIKEKKKSVYVIGNNFDCENPPKINDNGEIIDKYYYINYFNNKYGHYYYTAIKKESAESKQEYTNSKGKKCIDYTGGKEIIVIDGKESDEFDEIIPNSRGIFDSTIIGFYNGGKDYYYVIKDNGKYYYVLNGKKSESFDIIYNHLVDENNFYLIGKKGEKYFLIRNGKKIYESTNLISHLSLSTNGVFFLEKLDNSFLIKFIDKNGNNRNSIINNFIFSKSKIVKDLAISRHKLEKTTLGKKYINQVNILIDKISNKKLLKEKILKVYNKLDSLDLENGKYKRLKNVIIYLKSKIGLLYYQ